jgi:cytochrome b6-f complex iron-sulfur subunit
MERREFLLYGIRAGTFITVPVIYSACSKDDDEENEPDPVLPDPVLPVSLDLDSDLYSPLKNDGHAVTISNNIIVVNLGGMEFVALSSVCTHEGCIISYNHAAGNFPCPCHGSVFSSTGSVLQGPATVAVRRYPVSREGNILTIGD